jgi:L-ascorbate metabolism protein UlaG (beta-lactamase superfamily)
MIVTKLGHCCLLIKEDNLTILTDPGSFSTAQDILTGIDVILITHEHADHFHIESLKTVLKNNPEAKIFTVKGVGVLLEKEGISYQLLEHRQSVTEKGVLIEGFGEQHADMYPGWPRVDNCGYFIANKLFYPGDAFTNPGKEVDVLALPVAGPWMKLSEAIDYAKELKPKKAFPVHDGILKQPGMAHRLPEKFLSEVGIEWMALNENEHHEF